MVSRYEHSLRHLKLTRINLVKRYVDASLTERGVAGRILFTALEHQVETG